MYNKHYYCVIMAGGLGSRFWPISRVSKPKQFLDFTNSGKNFLRQTYDRYKTVVPEENIMIVSLSRYRDQILESIPGFNEKNLLLEPYNRSTAPCVTYAALELLNRDPDAVMVATPADHIIKDKEIFQSTITSALEYADKSGKLVAVGVAPTRADANFGYIQAGGDFEWGKATSVKTFTEKPSADLARVFIESGEFLWNSGIYLWRADAIKREMEIHASPIIGLWNGYENVRNTPELDRFLETVYSECPKESLDNAVMEKTSNAMVYPAKFSWADIGNWTTLYEYLVWHDEDGNASNIKGKSLVRESTGNMIYASDTQKLVALRGLENFLVVDLDDVLLICPRDDERLKSFISQLAMPEYQEFR